MTSPKTLCYNVVVKGGKAMKYLKFDFDRFDKWMKKILEDMTVFRCEICKKLTPKKYEGTEPNTCEMCMPKKMPEISTKNDWLV